MTNQSTLTVTVVYASETYQKLVKLEVPSGTTILAVIQLSGLQEAFPTVDFTAAPKGVFGETRQNTDLVQDGDRIEIYRELLLDPKEARRHRAKL